MIEGLSSNQVIELRSQGKGNSQPIQTTRTYSEIVRDNVFNFINNLLFFIGFLLILVGKLSDALVTVGILLINVSVGVVQEILAKRKLDSIALLSRPTCKVIRDKKILEVDPDDLVLGDILVMESGDQAPCDGQIMETKGIEVDESQLTGESDLIKKNSKEEILSGSFCVSGKAFVKIIRVGNETLVQKLTQGAKKHKRIITPLQRDINLIFKVFFLFIAFFQILFIINAISQAIQLQQEIKIDDLIWQSGVLVGLIPNSLLLMTTVAYSLGAGRIAGKGALVQQLNAIESLSNIDTLCLDKTGTLTTGKLKLKTVFPKKSLATAQKFAQSLEIKNKTSQAIEDPNSSIKFEVIKEIPFSSKWKWSALETKEGIFILGASDILLKNVSKLNPNIFQSSEVEAVEETLEKWTEQGLRVLALVKSNNSINYIDNLAQLPQNLELQSLIALADELRPNLKSTLNLLRQREVDFKIVSGDNPKTVAALVKQADIEQNFEYISGEDLKSDNDILRAVENVKVFGRIIPAQKEKIVEALNKKGKYTAMIGDGVNDVLSIKKAKLGIAMNSGSQITRNVADIILLEDDFAAIASALEQGQKIRNATQLNARLFVTRVGYLALLILATSVIGLDFPLTILQNSLAALLTAGIPAFFLTLWAKAKRPNNNNFLIDLAKFVVPTALLLAFTSIFLYSVYFLTYYQIINSSIGEISNDLRNQITTDARSVLNIFLLFSGLFVVLLVSPPWKFWRVGKLQFLDFKTGILVGLMFLGIVIGYFQSWFLKLFEISRFDFWEVIYIGIFLTIWLLSIRVILRRNLFQVFLKKQ